MTDLPVLTEKEVELLERTANFMTTENWLRDPNTYAISEKGDWMSGFELTIYDNLCGIRYCANGSMRCIASSMQKEQGMTEIDTNQLFWGAVSKINSYVRRAKGTDASLAHFSDRIANNVEEVIEIIRDGIVAMSPVPNAPPASAPLDLALSGV